MNINKYFEYYSEPIPAKNIFLVTEEILDDIYVNSSEVDRLNVFFHLQNEYFFLINNNLFKEAAYVCYLISYYLFTPLTPPHSDVIALEYIKKAIELDPDDKYKSWIEFVRKGN
jgi:hypothetical protein